MIEFVNHSLVQIADKGIFIRKTIFISTEIHLKEKLVFTKTGWPLQNEVLIFSSVSKFHYVNKQ